MKRIRLILIILIALLPLVVCSQEELSPVIDSLKSVLAKTPDKNQHAILLRISDEYLNYSLEESITYAQKSLDLAQRLNDKAKLATSYKKLGIIEYYCGNSENGMKYFKQALILYEQLKDKKQISNVSNNIGLVLADGGNFKEAIENYEKSMKIDNELGDSAGVGLTIGNMATIYVKIGDYQKASDLYNQSLKIARRNKDIPRIVSNLCNIGLVYHTWCKYTTAITYYLNALKEEEKEKDPKVRAQILLNLGVVYYDWKNYTKALEYYNQAYEIQNSMQSYVEVAKTLMDIAVLYDKWGKDDKALENYLKALDICSKNNSVYEKSMVLFNLATFYDTRKNHPKSLYYLKQSLEIRTQIEDNRGIAACLNSMGDAYMQENNYTEAKNCFNRAEQILKTVESVDLIMQNLLNLSDLYYVTKDYKKSRDYLYKYGAVRDSVFNADTQKELANMQTRYETDKKEKEIQLLSKDKALKQMELKKKNEEMKKQRILTFSFVIGFVLILIFSVFLFRLYSQKKKANLLLSEKNIQISQQNEEITAQRDEIEAQRDQIEVQRDNAENQRDLIFHQKHEIESSIHYAKRIQTALLPLKEIISQSVNEYFILFYPRDIVSGDFYWATKKGNQLVVVAADCTGHGVPGAFMSMLGISFLNEIVNRLAAIGPLEAFEICNQLRKQVISSLHQTVEEGGTKDGMDISLIVLDLIQQDNDSKKLHRLQFVGANNPLYIVSKSESKKLKEKGEELSTSDFQLYELKGDKMPIGVHERQQIPFTNQEILLSSGSQIYLFSDGYADQFGGPKEKKFKYAQLKEKILSFSGESMEVQKELFNKTYLEWKGSFDQTDDLLLIGLKV